MRFQFRVQTRRRPQRRLSDGSSNLSHAGLEDGLDLATGMALVRRKHRGGVPAVEQQQQHPGITQTPGIKMQHSGRQQQKKQQHAGKQQQPWLPPGVVDW